MSFTVEITHGKLLQLEELSRIADDCSGFLKDKKQRKPKAFDVFNEIRAKQTLESLQEVLAGFGHLDVKRQNISKALNAVRNEGLVSVLVRDGHLEEYHAQQPGPKSVDIAEIVVKELRENHKQFSIEGKTYYAFP